MEKYDVIVAGSYSLDLIFTGLEQALELGKEIYASGFEMIPGEAYNSAVSMHRLGMKVGWAGDFGTDDLSAYALQRARAEGMDESLFVHHQHPLRRVSVSASYPTDRGFITYYDPDPPLPAVVKALSAAHARAVYLPGLAKGRLFEAGMLLARARRMQLIMDGNSGQDVSLSENALRRAIASVDIFLPNAREARCLTGEQEIRSALKRLGEICPLVVVKDGANGAYAISKGEIVYAPAIPVVPVDTTGAGDSFNAGFLSAWFDGFPIHEALRWGNVVGGLSVTARGGTGRVIRRSEVEAWLDGHPG